MNSPRRTDGDERPIILFFNSWFGGDPPAGDLGSSRWTRDRSLLPEADIVIFHMPEFRRSTLRGLPKFRGQLWASMSFESNANYPLQADLRITSLFDVSIGLDRGKTIRQSGTPKLEEWQRATSSPIAPKTEAAPATMFQSALTDSCGRSDYARELMSHLRIDSYGKVLNNRSLPYDDNGIATKLATISRYRFCIGFENSCERDYVTEKLFQPLMAGTVPVYRGAPNAADFAPPGSFINADDFSSPGELANYLNHLANAPEEYRSFFNWRETGLPKTVAALARENDRPLFDRVSEYVLAHFPRYSGPHGTPAHPFGLWSYLKLRYGPRPLAGRP